MLVNVDDVNVAIPQQLVDAYIALDNFEESDAIERLGDDAYSVQFDALVEQIVAIRSKCFPNFGDKQFDQLEDQVWNQIWAQFS